MTDFPTTAFLLQPDGKIVTVTTIATAKKWFYATKIRRFNHDGSSDMGFAAGGSLVFQPNTSDYKPSSVCICPNGRLVVAGNTQDTFLKNKIWVLRLLADGSFDPSFNGNGQKILDFPGLEVRKAVIDAQGRIVLAGSRGFPSFGGDSDFLLARLNTDGDLDNAFGTNGMVTTDFEGHDDAIADLLLEPNGKIMVCGTAYANTWIGEPFQFFFWRTAGAIARYNEDGSLDSTWMGTGKSTYYFTQKPAGFSSNFSHLTRQDNGKYILLSEDWDDSDFFLGCSGWTTAAK